MLPPQLLPPPLYPLPFLIPWSFTSAALIAQNANLLVEKIVQRYVPIPIRLQGLKIQPFTSTITFSELDISDYENKPLIFIPNATTRIRFPGGFFKPPIDIEIDADAVLVSAILYRDGTHVSSNWTKLSDSGQQRSATSSASGTSKPPPLSSSSSPSSATETASTTIPAKPLFNISLNINHPQILLQNSNGNALAPTISIPKFHITSENIFSITSAAHLVDALITRVIRESKPRAFQSDARGLLRTWLRKPQTSSDIVDQAITWSKFNVPLLRKRMSQFRKIVDEVPGLQKVQSFTSRLDGFLQGAERALHSPSQPNDSTAINPSVNGQNVSSQPSKSDSGQKEEGSSSLSPAEGFRELDEELD